jgi:hypothetical protein
LIAILLRDLRWRAAALVLIATVLYALEPGFHQHDEFSLEAVALGPLGISAALSHFAGLSMIVLLAGFISTDRREGYTRMYFAQPTSPIAYYGLRWLLAYVISIGGAALFLVLGQLIAWGGFFGGWRGLVLPALSALVYGGLIAFFSVTLRRGDAWVTFLLLLPTFLPDLLSLGLSGASLPTRQAVMFILPPQNSLAEIWEGLMLDSFAWFAAGHAFVYGTLLLGASAIILALREWP